MVPGMNDQDFTISVWLHPTDTSPGTPVTLMVGRNSVTNFPTFSIEHFMNNPQDHTISFYVYYDFTYTNYQVINLDVSDNSNEWHHYIFSFNAGDSLYTYLDGNLLSSSTLVATSDTLNDATSRYHLGSTATYCNISTSMDELIVYNRSITSAEAGDLFTTGLTAIENQTKNNLPVYPNPANDVIQIGWNNTMAAGQGQITSADGKTVYNFTGQPSSIQIASYPPGLYFIRIWQNGQMYSSKFIKQ